MDNGTSTKNENLKEIMNLWQSAEEETSEEVEDKIINIKVSRNNLVESISEAIDYCDEMYCKACVYNNSIANCKALFIADYILDCLTFK